MLDKLCGRNEKQMYETLSQFICVSCTLVKHWISAMYLTESLLVSIKEIAA